MTGAGPTRIVEVTVCPAPNCGAANPSTYRFCMKCGAPLAESGTESTQTREVATAPDAEPACVTRILPNQEIETYDVDGDFVVGRDEGTLAIPDDQFLSRRHLSVRQWEGAYYLTDLDSSNGTFVRVRGEVELKAGDYIMLGSQVFRFKI
jgi:pSer/pThr/pTyr-binding forkhead associated (FHA) protein